LARRVAEKHHILIKFEEIIGLSRIKRRSKKKGRKLQKLRL